MEFRIEKTVAGLVIMAAALSAAEPLRFQVRHDHWRKYCSGTLLVDAEGISYAQTSGKKPKHQWKLNYGDIQQLEVSAARLRVLTYKDSSLMKLGTDIGFQLDLTEGDFSPAYAMWKNRLDERLVSVLADTDVRADWEIPVKLLGLIQGSHGVLKVAPDRIVYETSKKGASRTWRYTDIENVSTNSPFQLTLTTYERARGHYGSLKGFNFQLKERLTEARYTDLWRRCSQKQGLPVLSSLSGSAAAKK
ncbi:MAG: hypothetical protein JJE04_06890 [Acidobacteriia bacterium]|nr:hypothetical protein [Terriglobia bacterium]